MNSAAAAVNPPSLDLRFVKGVPVLKLDESADIERLRASIRTHLPGHLGAISGRASRLDLGNREINLFDLRRVIHMLRQEFGVEITGLYVRGPAIHRFAERELKLKLFPSDLEVVRPQEVRPQEELEELETEEVPIESLEEAAPAVFVPAPIETPQARSTPAPARVEPSRLERVPFPHDLTAAELAPELPAEVAPPAPAAPAPRLVEPPRTHTLHRTLRSGAIIRFEGDLYVFGDVNPGAQIIATGNIVVLGALKGVAHAGANGDESTFILAFDLRPTQLRIGRKIAVPPPKRAAGPTTSEIATVHEGQIVIEPYRSSSVPGPGRPSLASGSGRRAPHSRAPSSELPDPTRIRP